MKRLMIDPPSGWMYGFPKEYPAEGLEGLTLAEWLVDNGYPQWEITKWPALVNHCRYWEEDLTDNKDSS